MRHRKAGRRLSRSSGQRKALYRNLITELFRHGRLRTTEAKAKAIRAQAEKLITLSRCGQTQAILSLIEANNQDGLAALVQKKRADRLMGLARAAQSEGLSTDERETKQSEIESAVKGMGVHARRLAAGRLNGSEIVHKLFDDIGPRYQDRPGGYTRILKLGRRLGDAAQMALIELVEA